MKFAGVDANWIKVDKKWMSKYGVLERKTDVDKSG
jgi:hypothetical protein